MTITNAAPSRTQSKGDMTVAKPPRAPNNRKRAISRRFVTQARTVGTVNSPKG